MVSTGDVSTKLADYASDFDHDFETATPYYYAADLQTWSSKAEFTATRQVALYRFTFAASPHAQGHPDGSLLFRWTHVVAQPYA